LTSKTKVVTDYEQATQEKASAEAELNIKKDEESHALQALKTAWEAQATVSNSLNKITNGLEAFKISLNSKVLSSFWENITSPNATSFYLLIFGGLAIYVLGSALTGDFLSLIQNVDVARGLITSTVAIVSVAMAVI
jgi:hypothetical protein